MKGKILLIFISIIGCTKETKGIQIDANVRCLQPSKAMDNYPENKNNTDRAKYILMRLREESYLISQDRLGFTPLVSIRFINLSVGYLDIH